MFEFTAKYMVEIWKEGDSGYCVESAAYSYGTDSAFDAAINVLLDSKADLLRLKKYDDINVVKVVYDVQFTAGNHIREENPLGHKPVCAYCEDGPVYTSVPSKEFQAEFWTYMENAKLISLCEENARWIITDKKLGNMPKAITLEDIL